MFAVATCFSLLLFSLTSFVAGRCSRLVLHSRAICCWSRCCCVSLFTGSSRSVHYPILFLLDATTRFYSLPSLVASCCHRTIIVVANSSCYLLPPVVAFCFLLPLLIATCFLYMLMLDAAVCFILQLPLVSPVPPRTASPTATCN